MIAKIAWKPKLGKFNKWKIASARLRCLLPCQYLQTAGYSCEIFNPRHLQNYQLVIFQKLYDQENLALAQYLKEIGVKLVFDICDNNFYNPDDLPELDRQIEQLKTMISYVDLVTVSTGELNKVIQAKTNKPCLIIDDAVEWLKPHFLETIYSSFSQISYSHKSFFKIVWYGNSKSDQMSGGIKSLLKVLPELELLYKQIPLILTVISNSKYLFNKYLKNISFPVKYYPWNKLTFPFLFKQQDVCILPIDISPYTVCKTNNRLVLSLMQGVPIIADPITSYIEFKEYVLFSDWFNNLLTYATNPELGKQQVQKGQAYIQSNYSSRHIVSQWSNLFDTLLS